MTSLRNRLFTTIALLSAFAAFDSKGDIFTSCGIDLGAAGRTKLWGAFTIGGTTHVDDLDGTAYIIGDVGASGHGLIDMDGRTTIYGDVYYHTGGALTRHGNAVITGAIHNDAASDMLLDQAAIDAQNASDFANSLAATAGYPTKIDTNHNLTLTAVGACNVLRLTDFELKGGAVLTLVGTAAQAFVFNVSNEFELSGGARIILSGGITWDNVLWNYRGTHDVKISGGSKLFGYLVATHRKVSISNQSVVFGEVIANWIDLHGSIQNPRFTPIQNP